MAELDKSIVTSVQDFLLTLQIKGLRIKEAYLYGSFAKGKQGEWSDIDIAVVSPDFSDNRLEERIKLMRIASDIDDRIEPTPYQPDAFVDEDPLVWQIKQEGMPLSGWISDTAPLALAEKQALYQASKEHKAGKSVEWRDSEVP